MTTKTKDADGVEVVGEVTNPATGEKTALTRRKTGRPSSFTEEIGENLIRSAALNPSIKSCGEQHGVPYSTLMNWLSLGDAGDPRYMDFACRFHAARNWLKEKCIQNLIEIADDPSQGAAAVRANDILLRKLYPQEFGEQIFVSTMVRKEADGIDLSILPLEERRQLMSALRKLKAHNDPHGLEGEKE
jgi:hypothetical protein